MTNILNIRFLFEKLNAPPLSLSLSPYQVDRSWSWSSSDWRAVCCVQAELAVVHGGRGLRPQQPFCWSALPLDCQLPLCWKCHPEGEGNSVQDTFIGHLRQFPLISHWHNNFKLNSQCCAWMLDLIRLHIGERCAVVWGSVTSTRCCCMYWSSFPGCFTDFTLTR